MAPVVVPLAALVAPASEAAPLETASRSHTGRGHSDRASREAPCRRGRRDRRGGPPSRRGIPFLRLLVTSKAGQVVVVAHGAPPGRRLPRMRPRPEASGPPGGQPREDAVKEGPRRDVLGRTACANLGAPGRLRGSSRCSCAWTPWPQDLGTPAVWTRRSGAGDRFWTRKPLPRPEPVIEGGGSIGRWDEDAASNRALVRAVGLRALWPSQTGGSGASGGVPSVSELPGSRRPFGQDDTHARDGSSFFGAESRAGSGLTPPLG